MEQLKGIEECLQGKTLDNAEVIYLLEKSILLSFVKKHLVLVKSMLIRKIL